MASYKWDTHYRFHYWQVDANAAAAELERLSQTGPLSVNRILASAKSPRSPIHKGFDWDDAVGGQEWRKLQARGLLSSLRIIESEGDEPVRAFFNVVDQRGKHIYAARETVRTTEDYRVQVLGDALRRLHQVQARLADIEGMERELKAVARVIKSVEVRRDKLKAEAPAVPPLNHII